MATLSLTPTELSLVAAAMNDKIATLEAAAHRLVAERERLGVIDNEAETIGLLMRSTYARIARMCEQALDVPFVDQDEAIRMLFAEGTVVVGIRP